MNRVTYRAPVATSKGKHLRLSESEQGRAWLGQFESADLPLARRFLDDLIIVTPQAFSVGIRELIRSIVVSEPRAVAMYPIWEVAKRPVGPSESLFPLPPQSTSDVPQEPLMKGDAASHASIEWSTGGNPMIPDPLGGIAGSVGSLIHVISDLHKEFGSKALDRPALHVLKATKCQRIVLVDDFIGSGDRAVAYLEAFYRHPTIKSWCSYPGLRITIVCYAASASGLGNLREYRRHRDFSRSHPVEAQFLQGMHDGRSFWSDVERLSVVTLCRKYAPKTSRPRLPLGYADACSMIAFPYAVPNTTPAILWAGSHRWRALFPNRAVPAPLLAQFDRVERDPGNERLSETLTRIGQLRLANGDWRRHTTPSYRKLVLLLALRARGFSDIDRIADVMEENKFSCLRLVSEARRFGLLAADGNLTRQGIAELRYARTIGGLFWEPSPYDEKAMYFPTSLKGRQRSI
jgi:hypothetical protein